jgi:ribosomal-protein-alanine N-acetyltransferase
MMIANPASVHSLLRRLTEGDLDCIMEIELAAYPYPWTRGIFADCIKVGYDCWGLQAGGTLIGYCIQAHAAGENHLLNLCIAPEWQQQGFGSLLLGHAVRLARQQTCFCIFLEVRPSNTVGIQLYEKNGFIIVGERPQYYRSGQGKESAIVMKLDLGAGN